MSHSWVEDIKDRTRSSTIKFSMARMWVCEHCGSRTRLDVPPDPCMDILRRDVPEDSGMRPTGDTGSYFLECDEISVLLIMTS